MIIDFHNHYYPPGFLRSLEDGSAFRVTQDGDGNPVLHSPGDYNVLVPGHRDLDYRVGVLDEAGVDMQVITFTAPGTSIETPERAVRLARIINDGLADGVRAHPERFTALGTMPMNAPEAAAEEADRVLGDLGLPGVTLFSNASGVPLADPRFEPVFRQIDAHGGVVFIHPTYPLGVEAMKDYMLMPLVGFLMDTTLAAAHLVFAGIPDRFPNIRFVLGHLGGAVPYLAERFDRGYEAFERNRAHLTRFPSEVLKGFYYDTVNFDPACLRLALEFAGPDHIVAGSDYPHMIGSIPKMIACLRALDVSDTDRAKIMGGNAQRILGV